MPDWLTQNMTKYNTTYKDKPDQLYLKSNPPLCCGRSIKFSANGAVLDTAKGKHSDKDEEDDELFLSALKQEQTLTTPITPVTGMAQCNTNAFAALGVNDDADTSSSSSEY